MLVKITHSSTQDGAAFVPARAVGFEDQRHIELFDAATIFTAISFTRLV